MYILTKRNKMRRQAVNLFTFMELCEIFMMNRGTSGIFWFDAVHPKPTMSDMAPANCFEWHVGLPAAVESSSRNVASSGYSLCGTGRSEVYAAESQVLGACNIYKGVIMIHTTSSMISLSVVIATKIKDNKTLKKMFIYLQIVRAGEWKMVLWSIRPSFAERSRSHVMAYVPFKLVSCRAIRL